MFPFKRFSKNTEDYNSTWISLPTGQETHSFSRLNLLGYILLAYAVIEYTYILLPLQLTNPAWELQTMGRLVENVWGLLLGLTFVFYRGQAPIHKLELRVLSSLSWLALVLAIVYLLMLPLGVINTRRIDLVNTRQYQAQQAAQLERYNLAKERLAEGVSPQQLEQIAATLNLPTDEENLVQNQILGRIEQEQQQQAARLSAARRNQRRELLRNSLKWNLGTILISFCFGWLWWLSKEYRELMKMI